MIRPLAPGYHLDPVPAAGGEGHRCSGVASAAPVTRVEGDPRPRPGGLPMSTAPTVIVAGARTPMGRRSGSLKGFSGSDLGGFAIKGAPEKAGVAPQDVDYVIMGQVLTAGEGQLPARQAAAKAGIPMTVPALGISKVCLSGSGAIALADELIRAGEFDVVVSGGQESM